MMIRRRRHQHFWMNRRPRNHRQKVQPAHHLAIRAGAMTPRHHRQLKVDAYDHENVQIPMKMATNHRLKRNQCER